MELRQLAHFIAVAEDQSFTRAAERLYIGQSGLSASIKSLENELKTSLFNRTTRRVELTHTGSVLLHEARKTIAAAAAAAEAIANANNFPGGSLNIGTIPAFGGVDFANVLRGFEVAYPNMTVSILTIGDPELLMEHVLRGKLHLSFVTSPPILKSGVESKMVMVSNEIVICAPDHPLADRAEVTFKELAGQDFVEYTVGTALRVMNDNAFAALTINRRILCTINHVYEAHRLVAAGIGMALIPEALVLPDFDVRVLRLKDRALPWSLAAIMPAAQHLGAPASQFLRLVEEDCAKRLNPIHRS